MNTYFKLKLNLLKYKYVKNKGFASTKTHSVILPCCVLYVHQTESRQAGFLATVFPYYISNHDNLPLFVFSKDMDSNTADAGEWKRHCLRPKCIPKEVNNSH